MHALAEIFDEQAARMLSALLSDDRATIREHAAWALGSGLPRLDAMGRLIGQVAVGGFTGMLAQRTLEQWSSAAPETLAVGLESALLGVEEPAARARLVETLGLVRPAIATRVCWSGRRATRRSTRRCASPRWPPWVSDPAPRAVGEPLEELVGGEGRLADVARLALIDLEAGARRGAPRATAA